MITRRYFMTLAGSALAMPFAAGRLWAGSETMLGQMQINTLSDGSLVLPGDFILAGMDPAARADIIQRYKLPPDTLTPPCNVTLLRDGTNTVLFDVGAGPDFQPTAGKLADALAALEVAPEDVTHVVFTHGHPDHLWGLLDEFDEPVFANASHMIGQAEFDYWTDPNTVGTIGAARTTFAVGAARRLAAMAEQFTFFNDGAEILPGIAARMTPGHSPGHMSFELRSGSDAVMVVGDAISNHHVAFEMPDFHSGSDQDQPLAAKTRMAQMDQLASQQMPLIGFHLPGGGIGRVEKMGSVYRFVDET